MILSHDDIGRDLQRLLRLDPGLEAVAALAGEIPLRPSLGGLAGLVGIIVAQQVSMASADAIFRRLATAIDLSHPDAILATSEETFRDVGMSRQKQRTMLAIAAAASSGSLDFERVAAATTAQAVAELVAVHGIGVWTAECYLLFAAGHPDIFPAGDLALQAGVAHALRLPARPTIKALAGIAERWTPHRSIAARLFWCYYAAITRRQAAPGIESAKR